MLMHQNELTPHQITVWSIMQDHILEWTLMLKTTWKYQISTANKKGIELH